MALEWSSDQWLAVTIGSRLPRVALKAVSGLNPSHGRSGHHETPRHPVVDRLTTGIFEQVDQADDGAALASQPTQHRYEVDKLEDPSPCAVYQLDG